jgi:adenylosuccinate lyase
MKQPLLRQLLNSRRGTMINRYGCAEIESIWTDNHRFLLWSRIELVFLKAFKGIDVDEFDAFSDEWVSEIKVIEDRTKHDVAAFVEWLEGKVGNRYIHYGLTSSDILDTAFSLQIRETNAILNRMVAHLREILYTLSVKYKETIITGRTHGQAAERIRLGDKFSAYEMSVLLNSPSGPYYGKLSGSTGDYKYFEKNVEYKTLKQLGLSACPIKDGQIIHRSIYANYMNQWALLASVIAKIATDIRLLSQSEICEIQEGFSKGQMGSSSMPQKCNPIMTENLCGLARVIRGYQTTAMQNIELWNERDISHSSAERIIFPDAAIILGFMINRLISVMSNIQVRPDNILNNLSKHLKSMESQARMLALIDSGHSRKEAHELMRKAEGIA